MRIWAGEYYVHNILKSWFTQGFKPMIGIEPGTALFLAFANTTKPSRRCNGIVVLANANRHFVNTGEQKYHYNQQWERNWGRWHQWSSYIANLIRRVKKEKGEIFREQVHSAMLCALHCYLIILFHPLVIIICFNLPCFFIYNWKMLLHVCTYALVSWGLGNKNNLTWQNMLACSYYFLMKVWQMQKVVAYHTQQLQYASWVRWLLVQVGSYGRSSKLRLTRKMSGLLP
jgi:hypothetical protein